MNRFRFAPTTQTHAVTDRSVSSYSEVVFGLEVEAFRAATPWLQQSKIPPRSLSASATAKYQWLSRERADPNSPVYDLPTVSIQVVMAKATFDLC